MMVSGWFKIRLCRSRSAYLMCAIMPGVCFPVPPVARRLATQTATTRLLKSVRTQTNRGISLRMGSGQQFHLDGD